MPEPRTGRAAAVAAGARVPGLMLLGLLLGVAGGWVAGLLRAPRPVEPGR